MSSIYQSPEPQRELLACFDEHGNVVESQTRQVIHGEPLQFWHGVANVWLVNSGGEMLVSKRSSSLKGNPGRWQTYFGGHVKAGISFMDAAVLELDEEIGLKIDSSKLVLIEQGKYEPAKHFFESYAYLFSGAIEELHFNDGEITEVRWISFADYNAEQKENPDDWCNGVNFATQEKILTALKLS